MRESGGSDMSGEAPGGVVVVDAIVGSVVWRMGSKRAHCWERCVEDGYSKRAE